MFHRDVVQAIRHWRQQPLFAAVVVTILALGLGANTAVFALVEATLIRALPFEHGDEVVHFWQSREGSDVLTNTSYPNFVDIARRTRTMAGVAAYHSPSMTLTDGETARTVETVRITANFFSLLGVEPILGRDFQPGDDAPDGDRVVVLGYGFWQAWFGGDPEAVGEVLILDDVPFTVVGVLPQSFVFPRERRAEVWRPLIPTRREATARRFRWLHVIGRRGPGASLAAATAEMESIAADLAVEYPAENGEHGLRLRSMRDQVLGDTRAPLIAIYAAVILVLMITCANLAHLLLARGARRRQEMSIRGALGATRGQLVRQVLVEVLLLFAAGGAAGAVFAGWLIGALEASLPADMLAQTPYLGDLGLHTGVLGYGFAVALACGLVFGLAPALRGAAVAGGGSAASMSARGSAPRSGGRLLMGSQVALAVVLTACTLLLVRSTMELFDVDPGFDTDNLLTLRISLPDASYAEEARIVTFNRALVERVAALPGVVSAAAADRIPLSGNLATARVARPGAGADEDVVATGVHVVSPAYFETLRMARKAGRLLDRGDTAETAPVVVINQLLASALFGGDDPLGRSIRVGGALSLEVVGTVGDVKVHSIAEPASPAMYVSYAQLPGTSTGLVVRAAADPLALVGAIRAELAALDPALDIYEVRTMREMIDGSPAMFTRTVPATLLSGFAIFAAALVALGLFAVVGYDVASRTREIGVRRALGARPGTIVRDVTVGTLAVVAAGVIVGIGGALLGARLLQGVLFGVGAGDPLSMGLTAASIFLIATAACVVPARNAAKVEPTEALRIE